MSKHNRERRRLWQLGLTRKQLYSIDSVPMTDGGRVAVEKLSGERLRRHMASKAAEMKLEKLQQ